MITSPLLYFSMFSSFLGLAFFDRLGLAWPALAVSFIVVMRPFAKTIIKGLSTLYLGILAPVGGAAAAADDDDVEGPLR